MANETIRCYEAADMEAVVEAANTVFSTPQSIEYWEWKYHKNPVGPPASTLGEKDGTLIGYIGGIPARVVVNGREVVGTQEIDNFVRKEYRKSSWFLNIFKKRVVVNRERGLAFSFGFPNQVASKIARKLFKIDVVGQLTLLYLLVDVRRPLQKRLPKLLARLLAAFINPLLRLRFKLQAGRPTFRIVRIDRFDARFDRLWERVREDYPIIQVRNSEFLEWRYRQTPDIAYECWAAVDPDEEIMGFVVMGDRRSASGWGEIVDILTPKKEGTAVAKALVSHAVEHFRKQGVHAIGCWMLPHCHPFKALRSLGFVQRNTKRGLTFRNTDPNNPAIPLEIALDLSSWYVTMGDSDYA